MIRIHAIIAGFTQDKAHWHGPATVREKIAGVVQPDGVRTRVWLQCWNSNWKEISQRIWWLGERYQEEVTVYLYAYSWGAGWGAMELARGLERLNIKVIYMILCDPVYRHSYRLGNWRAFSNAPPLSWFMGDMKIVVPTNVLLVESFFQTINYPRAHTLVAADPGKTVIKNPIPLHVPHVGMDDEPLWQDTCVMYAKGTC